MFSASDSDDEDFLLRAADPSCFAEDEGEAERKSLHAARLERRRTLPSLVAAASQGGKGTGFAVHCLGDGSTVRWRADTSKQQVVSPCGVLPADSLRDALSPQFLLLILLQGVAWECALRLCRALEARCGVIRGTAVLELGCGVGVPGLVAARLGARKVVLTDTAAPGALDAAAAAIASNELSDTVVAEPLMWGDRGAAAALVEAHGPFSVVLCSDLIYGDEAPSRLLVETLEEVRLARAAATVKLVYV